VLLILTNHQHVVPDETDTRPICVTDEVKIGARFLESILKQMKTNKNIANIQRVTFFENQKQ